MNKNYIYTGIVILILVLGYWAFHSSKTSTFGATSCTSITCLSGGLRLVSDGGGAFESDVATSLTSTLAVTATTTLSDTVNFNNPGICINFYATSTATRMHMTASSTSLVNGVTTGIMLIDYGACAL